MVACLVGNIYCGIEKGCTYTNYALWMVQTFFCYIIFNVKGNGCGFSF